MEQEPVLTLREIPSVNPGKLTVTKVRSGALRRRGVRKVTGERVGLLRTV